MYSCDFCEMWCLVRVGDSWWVEFGLGHVYFGIEGPVCSRAALFQRPPVEVFQYPFNAAGVVVAV